MRLISRSFHTKMHKDMKYLNDYEQALLSIFQTLTANTQPSFQFSTTFLQENNAPEKKLFILVGSQKGLCGNYNATITHWIDKNRSLLLKPHVHIFVLSKKIDDYLKKMGLQHKKLFSEIKLSTIDTVTTQLLFAILDSKEKYTQVVIIANNPKTFFSHEYNAVQLIPFKQPQEPILKKQRTESLTDYVWSHDPHLLFETLFSLHLKNTLYATLFLSLSGEQSARFIAMDNATRNAQNFLDSMNLQFNKIRQAKITKELSELAGAFESQMAF